MGNSTPTLFALPSTQTPDNPDETVCYRHPHTAHLPKLGESPEPDVTTMQQMYLKSVEKYGSKPYTYQRLPSPDHGKTLGPYQAKTYQVVHELALNFGAGLIKLGFVETHKEYLDMEFKFLGIHSKNSEKWAIVDQACALFGVTSVPIYDTLGREALHFIYEQTNMSTITCTHNYVHSLTQDAKEGKTNQLKNIIVMDFENLKTEFLQEAQAAGFNVISFHEVIEIGSKENIPLPKVTPDDIYTFCYTSGTTGLPKAAMLSHRNFAGGLYASSGECFKTWELGPDSWYLSYLPLPHVFERTFFAMASYHGAHIGFFNGDILRIKEDLADFKPTFMCFVPRLLNRFHDLIRVQFDKLEGVKKSLVDRAVDVKLENFRESGTVTHALYDRLVFQKIRDIFGGRLKGAVTGSAPISGKVLDFMRIATCVPIIEGYGQTETTAGVFCTWAGENTSGHVGGPVEHCEFKIRSLPEKNYTVNDKNEKGEPTPRGEILIRGPAVICGYYKDKEKTDATFKDGWVSTGDIVRLNPNGTVNIIDRAKSIFKLAQGEYVSPEKIESVLIRHKAIAEAFVHGDSLQPWLVAVLVPDKEPFMSFAQSKGFTGTFEELCENTEFKKLLVDELSVHAKHEDLNGLEQPKRIHLEPASFATKGLFTTTFKLKRAEATKYFKDITDALYASVQQQINVI